MDKWLPFCQNHLKSGQEGPDFEWSGFRMVSAKAVAFEIQSSKSPDFFTVTIFPVAGILPFRPPLKSPDFEGSTFRSLWYIKALIVLLVTFFIHHYQL